MERSDRGVRLHRRGFLAGFVALALPAPAVLAAHPAEAASNKPRKLSFLNLHTDERLSVTYWVNGQYDPEALGTIDHFLRDWRTGDIHPIDPALLDVLTQLRAKLETTKAFHVISGYRSPKTNATLANESDGVAKKSLHMQGKAIDVALPGRSLKSLRKAAIGLQAGGVGYYPRSGFVHLDTGRVRSWG